MRLLRRSLPRELRWNPDKRIHQDAYGRSSDWLASHLTPEQRAQFAVHRAFLVPGSSGTTYVIDLTAGMRVFSNGPGSSRSIRRASYSGCYNYCISASGYNGKPASYLHADSALAVLLAIRADEAEFRRIAVCTGPYIQYRHPLLPCTGNRRTPVRLFHW